VIDRITYVHIEIYDETGQLIMSIADDQIIKKIKYGS